MEDLEYAGSKIQWVENGPDTWQIFRSKLIGRLAAKGCAQALLRARPEPLEGGNIAARQDRLDEIEKYDEADIRLDL